MERTIKLVDINVDGYVFDKLKEVLIIDCLLEVWKERRSIQNATLTYTEWRKNKFEILLDGLLISEEEEILLSFNQDDMWKDHREKLQVIISDLSIEKPLPIISHTYCRCISRDVIKVDVELKENEKTSEDTLHLFKDSSGEWDTYISGLNHTKSSYIGAKSKLTNQIKEYVKLYLLMQD